MGPPSPASGANERGQAAGSTAAETQPVDRRAHAVIMAGGGGTRFWPLSRRRQPKQFLAITGANTLLQSTWKRALDLVDGPDRILVVTGAAHQQLTREQLPDLPVENLLLEPQTRNTAPCVAWSAALLSARDPQAVAVVLPADHIIRDRQAFASAVHSACAVARSERMLMTFGVPPRYPETGYGYIEVGDVLPVADGSSQVPAYRVERFREKPDLATAERYVDAGNFLWNSGIFVWTVESILAALDQHLPEARRAAERMLAAAGEDARAAAYGEMPATSIDFGVMERAGNVGCVRAPFDWSDIGSWAALCEVMPDDDAGNVCFGQVVSLDAGGNLVHAPDDLVVLFGVERLAVVRSGGVLMVVSLERSQEIRELRQRLKQLGLEKHL